MRYARSGFVVLLFVLAACGSDRALRDADEGPGNGGTGGVTQGGGAGGSAGESGSGGGGGVAGSGGAGGLGGDGGTSVEPGWLPTGGPPGVDADSVFVTSTGTLLARADWHGLLRSADGGRTWTPTGGFQPTLLESALEAGGAIYLRGLSEGLFRSTDDGASWERIVDTWVGDPAIVATADGTLFNQYPVPSLPPMLRTSSDRGVTWTDIGSLPALVNGRLFARGDRLYVLEGNRLHSSLDGIAWSHTDTPFHFRAAVDDLPAFGGSLFAVDIVNRIWRSDDDGASWIEELDPAEPVGGLYPVASSLYSVQGSGIYERVGDGWERVGDNAFTRSHPVAGAGALWSFERSDLVSWRPDDPIRRVIDVESAYSSSIYVWAYGETLITSDDWNRVFRSGDGGATWERLSDLKHLGTLHPLGDGRWLGDVTLPDYSHGTALSTDDGRTWRVTLPDRQGFDFAEARDGVILGALGGQLHRSTDGGATWTPDDALPREWTSPNGDRHPLSVQLLERVGATIFAGSSCQFGACWVNYRSADGGETFTTIGDASYGLWPAFRVGGKLVAQGRHLGTWTPGLWNSEDDGQTWYEVQMADPQLPIGLQVAVGDVLYGTLDGTPGVDAESLRHVWRSADGGITWAPLGEGLPAQPVNLVTMGNRLFVGLRPNGVWVTRLE